MARDQVLIELSEDTWTELTNADVTVLSFQVIDGEIYIRGSDGTTPTEAAGWMYDEGEGEVNKAMSDLFKAAGIDRVFGKSHTGTSLVQVDHA